MGARVSGALLLGAVILLFAMNRDSPDSSLPDAIVQEEVKAPEVAEATSADAPLLSSADLTATKPISTHESSGIPASLAGIKLKPLLGEPRGPTPDFCDESHWSGLGRIMREFSAGEVLVDERDWNSRGQAVGGRMASWASKCKQGGAAIQIRGDLSGRILAVYDSETGYRTVIESPGR